jgi:predicted metalloprotease
LSNQQTYGGFPPPQPPFQGQPQQFAPPYGGQQPYGGRQFAPPPGGQPPGFGWGPQFQPGPGGFQQPPKKKSKAGWIAVPIVLVFAAVVGIWTIGVIAKHNKQNDYVTQPTSTASTDSPGSQDTPTQAPTAKATAPKPTKTTQPPRQATPYELVSRNTLYSTGLQRTVNCRESKTRATGIAATLAYYNQLKACLDRAWPRQIGLAKDQFRAPHLIAMTGPTQTPCSGGAPSSFYCPTNDTIYMDAVNDMKYYRVYLSYPNRTQAMAWLRMEMADTVAHEYGHHVQNLSGILDASWKLQYETSGDAALQVSRRREIQATCFGNVFLGVNKSSYPITGALRTQLSYLHSHQGDEYGSQPDHGSRQIIPYWANRGYNSHNPATCNTFTAASNLVR